MKKYLIALSLVGLVTTSCYEKLNITPPNAITNEQVMELLKNGNDETVTTIMGAMADGLNAEFKHTGSLNGWSNEYYTYAQALDVNRSFAGNDMVLSAQPPSGDDLAMYNFTSLRTSDNVTNEPFWIRGYDLVQAANKVFNLLTDELVETNGNVKLKDYQGRAYLTRAYGYLFLMENYGTDELGVPIYTRYTLAQEIQARASAAATFDSIILWTKKAISLFEAAGIGYSQNVNGDLNLGVANYVLARAALWKQDWATAITACDKLIANYSLMNENQYVARNEPGESGEKYVYYAESRGFTNLKANPECIMGWDDANKGRESANYWLNFMANGKQARIDNRLYEKIADQDYRKANFQKAAFGKFIAPSTNGFETDGSEYDIGSYINLKFAANVGIGGKIGNTTVSQPGIIDYSLFRVSEAYLMKAEAQAQSGQGDPKATLNILISARTNGALDCDSYPSMSGMSALDMVKLQTRIEMWGEHSLEFYNNRRWKVNVDRSGSTVHHTAGQIPYAQLVLQIPQQEINTNNLIVQNP